MIEILHWLIRVAQYFRLACVLHAGDDLVGVITRKAASEGYGVYLRIHWVSKLMRCVWCGFEASGVRSTGPAGQEISGIIIQEVNAVTALRFSAWVWWWWSPDEFWRKAWSRCEIRQDRQRVRRCRHRTPLSGVLIQRSAPYMSPCGSTGQTVLTYVLLACMTVPGWFLSKMSIQHPVRVTGWTSFMVSAPPWNLWHLLFWTICNERSLKWK